MAIIHKGDNGWYTTYVNDPDIGMSMLLGKEKYLKVIMNLSTIFSISDKEIPTVKDKLLKTLTDISEIIKEWDDWNNNRKDTTDGNE